MKASHLSLGPRKRRRDFLTFWLYLRATVSRFRWTLLALSLVVALGTVLYRVTPQDELGRTPYWDEAFFASWMTLFAQPLWTPPATWYLTALCIVYPLIGIILVGEGVIRLSLLIISRESGEKEWMKVRASTHRNHTILCGVGHLGYRILGELLQENTEVVVLEKDPQARFLPEAKALGVPILISDMKDDQALIDAGIREARCLILATNDDMANLEAAMDAKRMNPQVRILLRMYDQRIADKIKDTFSIDFAFSSAALAAPVVAALSRDDRVLAAFPVSGVNHLTTELTVGEKSELSGQTLSDLEARYSARVLAHIPQGGTQHAPPPLNARVGVGDRLVVHSTSEKIAALLEAAEPDWVASSG
jgi:Trk K+ transport system NAD-binding subunit